MNIINFTKELYLELKEAYNQALKENKVQFTFHNNILVTSYAKYLIEYLDSIYNKNHEKTD